MRRLMLLATTAAGLLIIATSARAQQDPYPALLRGAVDYAEGVVGGFTGTNDAYLTAIDDYGGAQYGFTLDAGESKAWGYQFYSPSLDSNYIVIVASQNGTAFGTLGAGSFLEPRADDPPALDTTGAFVASSELAAKLRDDADFNAYRAQHPDAAGPNVGLAWLASPPLYPPPPSIASDKPVWLASLDRQGDSIHICYMATGTGAFACNTYYNKSVGLFNTVIDNGNMAFGVSNFGNFGGNGTVFPPAASFVAPGGSGNAYVFGAGIWVGARKRVNGSLQPKTFITYDPNSGASWATPGEGYDERTTWSYPDLFGSDQYDENGEGGEFRWPLWLPSAENAATMMNPGTFVPLNGDRVAGSSFVRPAFVADVADQFVARYSDADTLRYDGNLDATGFPLGLQFQENIYANPGALDHTVIVSYDVINRSSDTLQEVSIAMVTDFDIGTATNDRTRFYGERPDLRTAVAWSANEARPTPYGMLVMTLVEAPVTTEAGRIDNSRRAEYRLGGTLGTYQAWKLEEDPKTSTERFFFMNSGERDGDQGAGDFRGLLASEQFMMMPGDTAHYAFSLVVNRGKLSVAAADAALETRIENIMNVYYGLEFSGVRTSVSRAGGLTLAVSPNPARDAIALRFGVARSASAKVEVFDHLGNRQLAHDLGVLDAGEQVQSLDITSLPSGAYIVVASCGSERVSVPIVVTR